MVTSLIKLILGISLVIFAIVIGPLAGIWAINTLFPALAIQYTWQTWLAYFIIVAPVTGLRWKR